jgi:hypothetical protein
MSKKSDHLKRTNLFSSTSIRVLKLARITGLTWLSYSTDFTTSYISVIKKIEIRRNVHSLCDVVVFEMLMFRLTFSQKIVLFFSMARQPYMGLGLLVSSRFHGHTHSDTPQSVGLLWTRDQLVAETSTWQHTTLTTDRYPCPRRFFLSVRGFSPLIHFCTV